MNISRFKRASRLACHRILKATKVGNKVTRKEEIYLLRKVFVNHPNWDEKSRKDIDYVYVDYHQDYDALSFRVKYKDGTDIDISYMKCFNDTVSVIKRAFRYIVDNDIYQFKINNLSDNRAKCPITGVLLTIKNVHVHHYFLSFEEILKQFFIHYNMSISNVKLMPLEFRGVKFFKPIDDVICRAFIKFHNEHAKLVMLSIKGHHIVHSSQYKGMYK